MEDYFNIGKLAAAFGIKGELVLTHKLGDSSWKKIGVLFTEESPGNFLPHFVTSAVYKKEGELYIRLEGTDTREQALALVPKNVYLRKEDFRKLADPASPLAWLGFSVHDSQYGALGAVTEVIEAPSQILIKVRYQQKDILIPVNDQTLQKIDRKKQILYTRLPDGLLEIY